MNVKDINLEGFNRFQGESITLSKLGDFIEDNEIMEMETHTSRIRNKDYLCVEDTGSMDEFRLHIPFEKIDYIENIMETEITIHMISGNVLAMSLND